MLLALRLTHLPAEDPAGEEPRSEEPERAVTMLYVPPPPPPPPPAKAEPPPPRPVPATPPPPPVAAPPPERSQPVPEPEANAPPDAVRSEGTESPEAEPPGATPPPPAPAPAPTMESEARRIFGRPRLGPRPGAGPRAVRPLEVLVPENPEKCAPRPAAPADSAPQFGVVRGRIFRQDDGRPLGGAHLQMLGTPYVSFTDDQGEYRFRFDLSLVDNCRTQYVRVSAPGYESRLLVLVVGANIMSEDVLLRRR